MIKISRMADYGVVLLAELSREPEVLRTAPELADQTGLPEPTVSKILKILAGSGLLGSVRGINGGYRLMSLPAQISVAAIITVLDGPICLTACADGQDEGCTLSGSCGVKGRWEGVNAVIRSALETLSLADLLSAAYPPSGVPGRT